MLFAPYAIAQAADFATADGKPGRHQFFAKVHARGSSEEFSSSTLTTQVARPAVAAAATGGGTTNDNLAPVAVDDSLTINEDHNGTINVLGNDSDPDGDPLTATLAVAPRAGTATITSAGLVTYIPARNYHGADALTYTAHDNHGHTASAVLHITINSVNDPPAAAHDMLTVAENTPGSLDVTLNDSDVDGDPLTVTDVSLADHGVATFAGAIVTYTPSHGFVGSDEFQYTVSDGHGGASTASVFVTVTAADRAPVAVDDGLAVDEDTAGTVDVLGNDSDPDGDALSVTGFSPPAHGTVTFAAGVATYTPDANFHGGDAFTYTVRDPDGMTASATVTVTVAAVDDPPVAADDAASTSEDTAVAIDVVANDGDLDGDALTVTAVGAPTHGTAVITDAHHVTYTPAGDFHGSDSFTYTIADPSGATASATVTVAVTAVNDPPVAADDAASLDENTAITLDVVGNDSDADDDALAITAVSQPAHGTVAIADDHHVTYTPALQFSGGDAFTYTVSDGQGGTASATVTITVVHVNAPPVAADDAATTDEDTAITVDVVGNDFDLDLDPLAITAITQPAHGLATVTDDHHIAYFPAPDFHGADALTYTISDGQGGTATASLAIEIASVNDAPVALADAASLDEDTSVVIDVVGNDADVDGDALAIVGLGAPAHGTAVIVDAHHVQYTPDADFHGDDAFTYTISDGAGGVASAAVALAIAAVNDPPVAVADSAASDEDTAVTIDVVGNDTDVDGDALAIVGLGAPAHGSAAIADAHHVTYTPAADFHGGDSFTYTIGDPSGATASATVTLAIASVDDAPVAAGAAASTFDDTPVAVSLTASDVDGDALTFAIVTPPAHGTLGAVVGGTVTYTPAAGFVGADSFTFAASDGQLGSAPATAAITVIASVCGNGVREGREECDDGNAAAGDGCEATCKLTCGSGTGADRATVDAASGHCFAAYDGVTHSYQAAAAMCGALGGHLPTITTIEEDDAAFAAVHAGDAPWLGGDDLAAEGTFRWITGEPFAAYSHFAPGKPDNAGEADCLRYQADGAWSDAACASTTGTLCEVELAVGTPVVATGGAGTRGAVLADFNGDGFTDLAATNPTSNSVGVLLGNGAGGFALTATYVTGAGASAIARGDFDGDGKLDLAVVNAGASTLVILHGTGTGTFSAGAPIAIAGAAAAIAAVDLDGDGKLDLAIGAPGGLQLWRGNGALGFALLGSLSVFQTQAIAAGDFDHDGTLDLAVATATAVSILHGTGPGTFAAPAVLASQSGNRALIASDLDGDGYLDLAAAWGAASVSVWFGGATGFGPPTALTVPGAPSAVAAGDFDGDGSADLAVVASGFAAVFHRAGHAFNPAGPPVAAGGTGALAAVAG
ncbi:MAG TPA: Ig-like domain-containing protein, partial [Kofleriaceae bacterium]|nr:Ig-like domain-containing protein [Kofleriaceae bacterium]